MLVISAIAETLFPDSVEYVMQHVSLPSSQYAISICLATYLCVYNSQNQSSLNTVALVVQFLSAWHNISERIKSVF